MEDGPTGEASFRAVTQRRRRGPAAVAVAAIAFVGFALVTKELTIAGAPVVSALPSSIPGAIATATAIAQAAPAAVSASGPPARDPAALPYPTFAGVSVLPGKTHLALGPGPTPGQVTVTLPIGWEAAGPSMYVKRAADGPVGLSIGAYSIQHVNAFPCRWASQSYTDAAYPNTAAGLASALSAFWGQDPNQVPFFSNSTIAPISTRPRVVAIGGRSALYVEVLIPSVLDFSQCDADQFVLWESADGSVRYGLGPGEIDRLWVVDMRRAPVVVDAALPVLASASDTAELQAVIDSISIGP